MNIGRSNYINNLIYFSIIDNLLPNDKSPNSFIYMFDIYNFFIVLK